MPKVDELQGGANAVALGDVIGVGGAVEMEHDAPDGVGGTAGVVNQFGEVLIARFFGVLLKGGKEVVKGFERQRKRGDGFAVQPLHQRGVRGLVGGDAVQFGFECG